MHLVPAIFVVGIILTLSNILTSIPLFDGWRLSLDQLLGIGNSTHYFLRYASRIGILFVPLCIIAAAQKKEHSQSLALLLGLILVFSTRIFTFPYVVYLQAEAFYLQSMVIPALLIGMLFRYLQDLFLKKAPQYKRSLFAPIMIFVTSFFFAYLIRELWLHRFSLWITREIADSLGSSYPALFSPIWGFLAVFNRLLGIEYIHTSTSLASEGIAYLWPILFLAAIGQGSAALIQLLLKEKTKPRLLSFFSVFFSFCGFLEPAVLLTNLPKVFPLISGAIGTAIAALFSISLGVGIPYYNANTYFVGGILGLWSIPNEQRFAFAFCAFIAILAPIVLGIIRHRIGKNQNLD